MSHSAIVPLSVQEAWGLFNGIELRDLVGLSDSFVEVRDHPMTEDGTPEYALVNKAGPTRFSHRSDDVELDLRTRTMDS